MSSGIRLMIFCGSGVFQLSINTIHMGFSALQGRRSAVAASAVILAGACRSAPSSEDGMAPAIALNARIPDITAAHSFFSFIVDSSFKQSE